MLNGLNDVNGLNEVNDKRAWQKGLSTPGSNSKTSPAFPR